MRKLLGMALLLVGTAHFAIGAPGVPEIGVGSDGSALALITGTLLVIRGRRK